MYTISMVKVQQKDLYVEKLIQENQEESGRAFEIILKMARSQQGKDV